MGLDDVAEQARKESESTETYLQATRACAVVLVIAAAKVRGMVLLYNPPYDSCCGYWCLAYIYRTSVACMKEFVMNFVDAVIKGGYGQQAQGVAIAQACEMGVQERYLSCPTQGSARPTAYALVVVKFLRSGANDMPTWVLALVTAYFGANDFNVLSMTPAGRLGSFLCCETAAARFAIVITGGHMMLIGNDESAGLPAPDLPLRPRGHEGLRRLVVNTGELVPLYKKLEALTEMSPEAACALAKLDKALEAAKKSAFDEVAASAAEEQKDSRGPSPPPLTLFTSNA